MKCVNCSFKSENLKKYGFYIGNSESDNYGNIIHQMNTTPITDYVCKGCLSKSRKKNLNKIILFSSIAFVFLLLIFFFKYLEYEGWKIFFIVIASLTGLPLLAYLKFYFDVSDIGDQIVINNYLYDNPQYRKNKIMTRNVYLNKNPILNSVLDYLIGGIASDVEYHNQQKARKKGYCPNGCGKLEDTNGNLTCFKCGWIRKETMKRQPTKR